MIYLYHVPDAPGAHSVLAYAFNDLASDISIYDPNHPGESRTIHYDKSGKSFDAYAGFEGIVYNGDGSLNLQEPYGNILNDAGANFSYPAMPRSG